MTITEAQSSAFYENRGLVLGEQCDDDSSPETLHRCRTTGICLGMQCNQCDGVLDDAACPLCLKCCDAELLDCACVDGVGGDSDCPGCDGLLVVTEANEWCDACGLSGRCPDCDPDRFRDERDDR